MNGEVCYSVQSFDDKEEKWCPRYTATPHYHLSERTKVVGHLWWKRRIKESFFVYGEGSRRRAFARALRRAKALPDKYVRIIMEVTYSDRRKDSYTQVWTN